MLLIVGRPWEPEHATWQTTLCSFRRIKINLKTAVLSVIAVLLSHNNGVLIYVTFAGKPTLVGLLERTFYSPWHLKTRRIQGLNSCAFCSPSRWATYEISMTSIIIYHHQTPFKLIFLNSYLKKLRLCVTWCPSDLLSEPDANLTTYISTSRVSRHNILKDFMYENSLSCIESDSLETISNAIDICLC